MCIRDSDETINQNSIIKIKKHWLNKIEKRKKENPNDEELNTIINNILKNYLGLIRRNNKILLSINEFYIIANKIN